MSDPAVYSGRAAVRAGVLVTGTEVLSGVISDRNGPWLSERLRDLGVDVAMIEVVGDRPADLLTALRHMAAQGLALIVTSGGLGPTADDLTAEVVGRFSGREMVLDAALEERIFEIVKPLIALRDADPASVRAANRKQAVIPSGATVLEPVGTAPGLVVAPPAGSLGPTVVVLPGPPRELTAMWQDAIATEAFQSAIRGAVVYRREIVRLYNVPEAEIASTLRAADDAGVRLAELEITTCLRRGELEVSTRFEPAAAKDYKELLAFIEKRHSDHIFSRDGSTIDEQVAAAMLAQGETIALAESCTGGLLAARLTERPGSSAYVRAGAVVYSNEAKTTMVGVDPELITAHGAVSVEVARALADGARTRFGASLGVGITGIAGPGGGTPEKPVGLVCFSVVHGSTGTEVADRVLTRSSRLNGDRATIRDRATTVAMHLIRRVLDGDSV